MLLSGISSSRATRFDVSTSTKSLGSWPWISLRRWGLSGREKRLLRRFLTRGYGSGNSGPMSSNVVAHIELRKMTRNFINASACLQACRAIARKPSAVASSRIGSTARLCRALSRPASNKAPKDGTITKSKTSRLFGSSSARKASGNSHISKSLDDASAEIETRTIVVTAGFDKDRSRLGYSRQKFRPNTTARPSTPDGRANRRAVLL